MPRRPAGSGAGTYLTEKGYVRIGRRGPLRDKLLHRVIMAQTCREFCFWPIDAESGIPFGMEVHHADFDKLHNCPQNLMLLDPSLHLHMHQKERMIRNREERGRFGRESKPDPESEPPDWVVGETVP